MTGIIIAITWGFMFVFLLWVVKQTDTLPNPEKKAKQLLRRHLTEAQWKRLISKGYLEIPSPNLAERVYHIPKSKGMIRIYDRQVHTYDLCVGPSYMYLPNADLVLAHKLMIEGNEEVYLRQANLFPAGMLD